MDPKTFRYSTFINSLPLSYRRRAGAKAIKFNTELYWTNILYRGSLNTVWLNNMIHFGLRGCKEQKELRWGDIVLKTDSDGKEYLEYFERQTKTRT